jgi:hypothetical protein
MDTYRNGSSTAAISLKTETYLNSVLHMPQRHISYQHYSTWALCAAAAAAQGLVNFSSWQHCLKLLTGIASGDGQYLKVDRG